MSSDPTRSNVLGYCRWCGAQVSTDHFRDLGSLREYRVGGSCQDCQDLAILGVGDGDADPPVLHRVRHGVIVGAARSDEHLHEVALLPFLFVVARRRLVWETRYIVRAGAAPDKADTWLDLGAMGSDWDECNVRVLCVPSPVDPLVRGALIDRDLVIGLDSTAARVAAQTYPQMEPPVLVSLGAEVAWRDTHGAPLHPLGPFLRAHALDDVVGPADACRSALRQCVLIARLLGLPATAGRHAGRSAFELLLLAHAHRFEESSPRHAPP